MQTGVNQFKNIITETQFAINLQNIDTGLELIGRVGGAE